jgi:hypothetical protein
LYYAQTRFSSLDPPYEVDLFPRYEELFLPPTGITPKDFTRTNPQTNNKTYTENSRQTLIAAGGRKPYPIGLPQQRKAAA